MIVSGKVETGQKNSGKILQQQAMSKIARRNQAKQKQQIKHQEHARSSSVFAGLNGAPRIVAVIALSEDCNAREAITKLNEGIEIEAELPANGLLRLHVDRFKQNIQYIPVSSNLYEALDACRIADFICFVLSPKEETDGFTELMLRTIEGQGVSNVLTMVQGLNSIETPKRRSQVVTSLKLYITHFFPGQEKVHSLDSHQECANVMRSLCTTAPKGIRWREDRSWMFVEDVQWSSIAGSASNSCVLTGVIRGRAMKSNRLLRVGDFGEFQISKITSAPYATARKRKHDEMVVDNLAEEILEMPDDGQDDVANLAPEEIAMDDVNDLPALEPPKEKRGVLLDDHHYFSDDETHVPQQPKRLPKGTSSYQAAWFLGDISDSGSDMEEDLTHDDEIMVDSPAAPQDGLEGLDLSGQRDLTEAARSEYPQSEAFLDPSPNDEAEDLEAYRSQRKNEAEEDLEFPDEVELHPNVLARERLARYRGLKSLRTSHWAVDEDRANEPENWNRLLQIPNYKGAKSQALREALVGGVKPGTRVNIHLCDIPSSAREALLSTRTMSAFSLLRHEHKQTVMNFSITIDSQYTNPIRSKEELIMQCGPRRFIIHPLFSQAGNTPNNVHKFDRYLHPGRTAIATFIAPLTWGSVPTLFFKRKTSNTLSTRHATPQLELIGTGTSLPPDPSRVIAKRVILTGHPYKIHKKLVTVRYMFFNVEDVNWFKALQLWTKRGRSGFVKESLGTHGYFKATFDGRINPQDAVGVSLYKRVFPRGAVEWRGGKVDVDVDVDVDGAGVKEGNGEDVDITI